MSDAVERAYRAYFQRPITDETYYKNRAEEEKILEAILEGNREPETEFEKFYLNFMGGPSPKNERPHKWRKCLRCGVEWKARGFPKPEPWGDGWLFPTICLPCADYMDAHAEYGTPAKSPHPLGDGWKPFGDE